MIEFIHEWWTIIVIVWDIFVMHNLLVLITSFIISFTTYFGINGGILDAKKNMAFSWNNILILTFWNVKKAFQVFCCSCLESVYPQDCGVFDIFATNLLFHLCSSKNCNPQSITIIKIVQVFCLKGENNTMSWHIQFLWKLNSNEMNFVKRVDTTWQKLMFKC